MFDYNNKDYDIVIEKKLTTKNLYIRVKKDLKIYITCNSLTTNNYINKLIKENYTSICNMIDKIEVKNKNNDDNYFYYLGNKYLICDSNSAKIIFDNNKVSINKLIDINKWYKLKAKDIFNDRINLIYDNFSTKIPYPDLRIRKMSTRWGVCNYKDEVITLNLELIKRDIKYLDYVIVHELSHLIYHNHSKDFWLLVEQNCPNYKEIRKEMRSF